MWPIKVIILALCCAGHSSKSLGTKEKESAVYFVSRNFFNVLHWKRRDALKEPVLYSVQYNIYGSPWRDKMECQNITALSCDLTAETSDITEYYNGKVMANGVQLYHTTRFQPLRDTTLEAPSVTATPGETFLDLVVRLTAGPQGRPSLEELLSPIDYIVTLTMQVCCQDRLEPPLQKAPASLQCLNHSEPWTQRVHTVTSQDKEIRVKDLRPNTEYHGSVEYTYKLRRSQALTFCVKTHKEAVPLTQMVMLTVPCLLGALLVIALLLIVCRRYLRGKDHMPDSLNIQRSKRPPSPLRFPIESLVCQLEVESLTQPSQSNQGKTDSKSQGLASSSDSSYAPQDCSPSSQHSDCRSHFSQQGETTGRSSSAQSSTQYSLVVSSLEPFLQKAHVAELGNGSHGGSATQPGVLDLVRVEGNTDLEGTPLLRSHGAPPDPGPAALMLHTSRGADNLLQLHDLLPLMTHLAPATAKEAAPLLHSFGTDGETEQLSSPAGEVDTRTYLPSTVPVTMGEPALPASVRQAWVSATPPLTLAGEEAPEWDAGGLQTWLKDGAVEAFLEGWDVQIQGHTC